VVFGDFFAGRGDRSLTIFVSARDGFFARATVSPFWETGVAFLGDAAGRAAASEPSAGAAARRAGDSSSSELEIGAALTGVNRDARCGVALRCSDRRAGLEWRAFAERGDGAGDSLSDDGKGLLAEESWKDARICWLKSARRFRRLASWVSNSLDMRGFALKISETGDRQWLK
jgi:hypothetical protein